MGVFQTSIADGSIEGHWQGTIQSVLRIRLNVARDPAGRLRATVDSPDQGATGLTVDTVSFTRDSLCFEMRQLRADYAGRMSADGKTIEGRWQQSGAEIGLTLARLDSLVEERRPQDPTKPYPYEAVEVGYENPKAKVHLAGTITLPPGKGPFPAVLLITGSGAEDRDETVFGHRPFLILADHLTRKGIAVLRVDDRGVGGSTGDPVRATTDDFAGDALAGVAFLKTRRVIDPKRIGLIGHSEGGLIAPLAASRSRDVAFIVLLAAPGVPGSQVLEAQGALLLKASGLSDSTIARQRAIQRRIFDAIRSEPDSAKLADRVRQVVIEDVAKLSEQEQRWIGDPEAFAKQQAVMASSPWFRYFLDYDPRPVLRQIRVPVLALSGEKDLQVAADENLTSIQAALRSNAQADVTAKKLPGLNHLFQTSETGSPMEYARIEETFAPAALEEISRWIIERTRSRKR